MSIGQNRMRDYNESPNAYGYVQEMQLQESWCGGVFWTVIAQPKYIRPQRQSNYVTPNTLVLAAMEYAEQRGLLYVPAVSECLPYKVPEDTPLEILARASQPDEMEKHPVISEMLRERELERERARQAQKARVLGMQKVVKSPIASVPMPEVAASVFEGIENVEAA